MPRRLPTALRIGCKLHPRGFDLLVDNRPFPVRFPGEVWRRLSEPLRETLAHNICFGASQVLPLVLNRERLVYGFPQPLLETFFFQNHLFDLLSCEAADEAPHLSYIRRFFNLEYQFQPKSVAADRVASRTAKLRRPAGGVSAILPFSFGKESLVTLGLCLETGIKPILMYCQEPSQPFEERYKRRQLDRLCKEFGLKGFFVRFAPGLFRYGKAFRTPVTELGWGSQTTLLSLLAVPFAEAYGAQYILLGSEQLNNESRLKDGWRLYPSYDQTSHWTAQQRHMVSLLTGGRCGVYSTLEPLEEANIFSLLHHRYPELGKYHFSCSAERPLVKGTAWCHRCYKCERMFLFARGLGIGPGNLGFQWDLLKRKGGFKNYFGAAASTGSRYELDFAFLAAYRKGRLGVYAADFKRRKLPKLQPWREYVTYFSGLHPHRNLPPAVERPFLSIFRQELKRFAAAVSSDR